ncbi:hypothetical protein Y032_0016g3158 [Ancylostoma ceylanicum]|uniref:Major facilitator superfamily (MFS) profile domain-containing protein n=2 Tax=Ancylostoma ceylanicum TaxID=53326 RepID=A0A016V8X6_9BILA|nr:hypothetical protein Y032_0016g3158 [Ancylostoma ceylanicum]
MTTSGESPPDSGHDKKNGNLPVVIISEPGSPDVVEKMDPGGQANEGHLDQLIIARDRESISHVRFVPSGRRKLFSSLSCCHVGCSCSFLGTASDYLLMKADHPPYFEDEECGSLDGMNQELDFSTLSINFQAGADAAVELLPVPPDGGYGWVIVLAAFFSNLIVDGVCTCFTEFKSSYSQHFHSSDAATALIGSLLIGVYLLVGPVVGGLVNKYGARKVVIGGAFISGTAFLISVASPNIYFFMLIYGVLGGVGFGMIYLPAIVVVGYYFESKRAIATGIAVAGSGVGTMVMPFLTEFCISSKQLVGNILCGY